jgi:hypothetical protein
METVEVQCPHCYQIFEVAVPPLEEQPCVVDYDCEICCHPIVLRFAEDLAEAHSLAD